MYADLEMETLQHSKTESRVSFGLFEADLKTGELWKAGYRVKLQGLPFRVLRVLLEHAGEVVSRNELQAEVWGPDVIVDFEHALSNAIKKLREALGDNADNPRFIETLSRRGFRFIAPVVFTSAPSQTAHNATQTAVDSAAVAQPDGTAIDVQAVNVSVVGKSDRYRRYVWPGLFFSVGLFRHRICLPVVERPPTLSRAPSYLPDHARWHDLLS